MQLDVCILTDFTVKLFVSFLYMVYFNGIRCSMVTLYLFEVSIGGGGG